MSSPPPDPSAHSTATSSPDGMDHSGKIVLPPGWRPAMSLAPAPMRRPRWKRRVLIALLAIALAVGVAAGLATRSTLTALAAGAVGFLLVCAIGAYTDGWTWTGIGPLRQPKNETEDVQPGRTLWDLVQVVIIPAVLVFGVWWLNDRQTTTDKSNADKQATVTAIGAQNQARDTLLDTYLSQMSALMLQDHLGAHASVTVRTIARARTLTALPRLDPDRQVTLMRFLSEAKLLPVVELEGVNLTGVGLSYANLSDADLSGANLSYADLRGAILNGFNFRAHRSYDDLIRANLSDVNWNHTTCPDGMNSSSNHTSPQSCDGDLLGLP